MGFLEFKEKVMKDKAFAVKFKDVTSPAKLVELAKAEGFTFTEEDVKNNTELTGAELESVAGGATIMAKTYFVRT